MRILEAFMSEFDLIHVIRKLEMLVDQNTFS